MLGCLWDAAFDQSGVVFLFPARCIRLTSVPELRAGSTRRPPRGTLAAATDECLRRERDAASVTPCSRSPVCQRTARASDRGRS
jgi:hypothetical protein